MRWKKEHHQLLWWAVVKSVYQHLINTCWRRSSMKRISYEIKSITMEPLWSSASRCHRSHMRDVATRQKHFSFSWRWFRWRLTQALKSQTYRQILSLVVVAAYSGKGFNGAPGEVCECGERSRCFVCVGTILTGHQQENSDVAAWGSHRSWAASEVQTVSELGSAAWYLSEWPYLLVMSYFASRWQLYDQIQSLGVLRKMIFGCLYP